MKPMTKVSLGLFAAWAINDVEELATMRRGSRDLLAGLPRAIPVPDQLRREGCSQRHVTAAIAATGLAIGAASVPGARPGGRSPVFRGTLLGFGLHGFGHIAMTARARAYVTGVATAPTAVIPYWLWARRELAREGMTDLEPATVAIAAAGMALIPGIHALVYRCLGE